MGKERDTYVKRMVNLEKDRKVINNRRDFTSKKRGGLKGPIRPIILLGHRILQ